MFKPRTKIGKWLDKRSISQEWIVSKTKLSRTTVSKIAGDKDYTTTLPTIKKIMKAIREIEPGAKADDYFDL
ncbi:transcriptional regulator [Bacillus infantis]|uniref:transcriptional regulator n=1 Tax=Bacillus infantis TaxID=324767 RepID=UPI003CE76A50